MQEWNSGIATVVSRDICSTMHADFFNRAINAYQLAFQSMRTELIRLEEDMLTKLNLMQSQQSAILNSHPPSNSAMEGLRSNIQLLDKKLEAFTMHAGNLSHIKLTLTRAATFLSNENSINDLVVVPLQSLPIQSLPTLFPVLA